MYNQREIKILNLLLVNDYSGEELAQQLNTSRRTVIRDIASINTELAQENIGEITAFNGYHLKLLDSAALRQILDRSEDEKNQILLALCLTQTITQADLSAQLFLSKAAVQDYVEQLNIELHGVITIKSHVGAGLGISFTRLSAVDIVAALFLEYPRLQKMLPIELIQQEHIEQLGNSLLNPYAQWLTRMQWHNQLLACLVALPIDEASSQMQFPIPSLSGISKVQQQHLSLFLSHRMMQMQAVLSQKQSLLESFTRLSHQFQLSGVGLNTFEDIFSHIVREVAFPRPIAGLNQSEMYRLQAQNPIAFDLAHTFTEVLLDQFPECWWDDRYIGLYIVQAINQRAVQPVRVLLLAPRASLQKINQTILQQQLSNTQLVIANNIDEALTMMGNAAFDVTLANVRSGVLEQVESQFMLVFPGIITEADIKTIERLVDGHYYHDNLAAFLPPNHFVSLPLIKRFDVALKKGLDIFVERQLLTAEDEKAIIDREAAGNQLILNHVSLPHTTSTHFAEYGIFAIKLANEVTVADTTVQLLVVVLANTSQVERNTIFSYFYQTLRKQPLKSINAAHEYEDVLSLLGGHIDQ